MKKHLRLLGIVAAYSLLLQWFALPIIREMRTEDRIVGTVITFIMWVIALIVAAVVEDSQ